MKRFFGLMVAASMCLGAVMSVPASGGVPMPDGFQPGAEGSGECLPIPGFEGFNGACVFEVQIPPDCQQFTADAGSQNTGTGSLPSRRHTEGPGGGDPSGPLNPLWECIKRASSSSGSGGSTQLDKPCGKLPKNPAQTPTGPDGGPKKDACGNIVGDPCAVKFDPKKPDPASGSGNSKRSGSLDGGSSSKGIVVGACGPLVSAASVLNASGLCLPGAGSVADVGGGSGGSNPPPPTKDPADDGGTPPDDGSGEPVGPPAPEPEPAAPPQNGGNEPVDKTRLSDKHGDPKSPPSTGGNPCDPPKSKLSDGPKGDPSSGNSGTGKEPAKPSDPTGPVDSAGRGSDRQVGNVTSDPNRLPGGAALNATAQRLLKRGAKPPKHGKPTRRDRRRFKPKMPGKQQLPPQPSGGKPGQQAQPKKPVEPKELVDSWDFTNTTGSGTVKVYKQGKAVITEVHTEFGKGARSDVRYTDKDGDGKVDSVSVTDQNGSFTNSKTLFDKNEDGVADRLDWSTKGDIGGWTNGSRFDDNNDHQWDNSPPPAKCPDMPQPPVNPNTP